MHATRTEKLAFWICGLSLLFFLHGNHWAAYWLSKWALFMGIFFTYLSIKIAHRIGYEFLPLMLVMSFSALYLSFWPEGPYLGNSDYTTVAVTGKDALQGLLIFWGLIGLIGSLPFRLAFTAERFLAAVGIFSAGYTIIEALTFQAPQLIGYSGNASMNGCLIVCLYPFMKKCLPRPIPFILTVTAVFLTRTSIPVGVLAIVLLFQATARSWMITGMLALGLMGSVFAVQKASFFSSSNRFPVWYSAMGYWYKESSIWFGAGAGSGQTLFPYVQATVMGIKGHYFLWLHSDWLQIIFEYGIIGFVAVMIAWISIMWRSLQSPTKALTASLMGFSACAVFNYPLRLTVHAVCLTLVVWLAIQPKTGVMLRGKQEKS